MSGTDFAASRGGIYDTCLAITEEGDTMNLMKCAIEAMDATQKRAGVSLNDYLLILSVRRKTHERAAYTLP